MNASRRCDTDLPVGSGSGYEEALVWLGASFVWRHTGGHVLHKFAATFRALAFDYPHASSRHGAGFQADEAAFAHDDLRAEPIGAKHATGGIEGHRRRDGTFEFRSRAGQNAFSHLLRPGQAPDEGIVQAATLEGCGVREFTQLQKLQ